MANILDIQTVGDVLVVNTDTNPIVNGGTQNIPQGSLVIAKDGSGTFYKINNSDTGFIIYNSIGSSKNYFFYEEFGTGALPTGWNQSTGAGGSVSANQPNQNNSTGIFNLITNTNANARSGIKYSNGVAFLLSFTDSYYTEFTSKVKWDNLTQTNYCTMFGWINSNNLTRGNSTNTLCIMYDPLNISGYNTGLVTNLFLLARAIYGTPTDNTVVDLGVIPDANWRNFSIAYDNSLNEVRVYRDGVLLNKLIDLSNVPAGSVRGDIPVSTTNSLQPTFYVGNGSVSPSVGANLKIDNCIINKVYNN